MGSKELHGIAAEERNEELYPAMVSEVEDEAIVHAINKANGNLRLAAEDLGVERTRLSRRVTTDMELTQHREEAKKFLYEDKVEVAESVIWRAMEGADIKRSQYASAMFFLKCKGGYAERREYSGVGGGPIMVGVTPVQRATSIEEWKSQNRAVEEAPKKG